MLPAQVQPHKKLNKGTYWKEAQDILLSSFCAPPISPGQFFEEANIYLIHREKKELVRGGGEGAEAKAVD